MRKTIVTVGTQMEVTQAMEILIEIGRIQADITAYVVAHAPADILLGIPFLMKYSAGFRRMVQEFSDKALVRMHGSIEESCSVDDRGRLEALLDKYPKLVVGDNEVPEDSRYYKAQTFDLGLPEEKKETRFTSELKTRRTLSRLRSSGRYRSR